MKKIYLVFLLCGFGLLAACENELAPVLQPEAGESSPLVFNLSATHPDGEDTKAVKSGWETGDVIFVFFPSAIAPNHLRMRYDKNTTPRWTCTAYAGDTESETALNGIDASGELRAVFLPFGSDASVSVDDAGGYVFSKKLYSYYLTATAPYTVSGTEVTGTLQMAIPEGYVQFFVNNSSAGDGAIELRERHLTPQGVASVAADGSLVHTILAHGAPLPGYTYDKEDKLDGEEKGILFSGILSPDARNAKTDYYFTLVEKSPVDQWAKWQYFKKSYANQTMYRSATEGRAVKLPVLGSAGTWTAITDYKPIDLGCDVPTGVGEEKRRIYWATMNVGASSPEEYGDYFAWGETTKKDDYSWSTYLHANGSSTSFTKYCNNSFFGDEGYTDALTTLEKKDDAASVNLGGSWRMPTSDELEALKNNCTRTEETINGKRGCWFTSNINGNSIFLPAAGYRFGAFLYDGGSYGKYWSSSLYAGSPSRAWYLYFASGSVYASSDVYRYNGFPVRPVTE